MIAFEYFQFWDEHKGEPSAAVALLWPDLVWWLFFWITGAMTALLAQDSVWHTARSQQEKRALDGLAFGVGWGVIVSVVWFINGWVIRVRDFDFPFLSGLAVTCFVGFLIGFFVIHKIRDGSSLRSAVQAHGRVGEGIYAR
jgi:hypothetical protein